MARRAFVTGATGFIGRHLVERLISSGWAVNALVRPTSDTRHLEAAGVELQVGDLANVGALTSGMASADAVFHLAAVTTAREEREYEGANAEGTRSVLAAIAATDPRPARLVYLSSYAAAGPAVNGTPRSCAAAPAPLTAYGRTKLAGEYLAHEAEGVEVVVVRAPVVYGPGDRALLPYFRLVRWGFAPVPGGEDRKLHLVYAPDLAEALRRAADAPSGTYAVADPSEHGWGDIIEAIAGGMRKRPLKVPLPPRLVRAAATATETFGRLRGRPVGFNREKAEEMLASAWICDLAGSDLLLPSHAVTPLRDGIERTTRWYIRQGWL